MAKRTARSAVLLRESLKGGGLVITTFAQSVGAERLTNGNFATWAADDPGTWAVQGESAPTREMKETAADGTAGTGSATLISSSGGVGALQFGLLANAFILASVNITNYVSGTFGMYMNSGDSQPDTFTSAGIKRVLRQYSSSSVDLWVYLQAAGELTIDDASVKVITPHPLTMFGTDGTFSLDLTLPGTTYGGQTIYLLYRAVGALSAGNYWTAVLKRNSANTQWDFYLYSWEARVYTARATATNVGDVDAIGVIVSGNTHQGRTRASNVWTNRGSLVTNTTHAAGTGITTVYDPGFTATRLDLI
jgi:hypothetical protein